MENIDTRLSVFGELTRRPRPNIVPTYLNPCDQSLHWKVLQNGSVSNDTAHWLSGRSYHQSIKMRMEGSGTVTTIKTILPQVQDLSKTHMMIRFRILQGSDKSSAESIKAIKFYVITNNSNYGYWRIYRKQSTWKTDGWMTASFPSKFYSGRGTVNWASISEMNIRVESFSQSATPSVIFDNIMFFREPSHAYYAMTFDDGVSSYDDITGAYEAAAYLASYGLRATFYIIPHYIESGYSKYLTISQLKDMQEMGHLIASHTYSHPVADWSTNMTDEEMADELVRCIAWLCEKGFSAGARLLAVPGGRWKPSDVNLYTRYLHGFRNSYSPGGPNLMTLYDPTRAYCAAWDNADTADTALEDLQTYKGICVTGWHYFGGKHETYSKWQSHVDKLASAQNTGKVQVVTTADLLNALN